MARYAIITSIHYRDGHIPRVIIEPGNDEPLQFSGWSPDKASPPETNLDYFTSGNSYANVEVGDYSGAAKTRVDEIVKTGRLPKEEEDKIKAKHEQWWGKGSSSDTE